VLDYGKTLEILRLTDGECWHLEDAADDVIKTRVAHLYRFCRQRRRGGNG